MAIRAQEREQAEAINRLREMIEPGDTLYTILRHTSASGMTRAISVIVDDDDGPYDVSYLVARVLGERIDPKHGGVRVSGAGMDMGYHLVYGTARSLFSQSFDCIGEGCPSNDHSNGDRDYTPHRHSDGGYALLHRWL